MIIGISGKIGSGKSEVARQIKKTFPEKNFKIKSFGYMVKKIVSQLTGVDLRTCLSRNAKNIYLDEWRMTLGEMYQKVGTDCMRDNLHKNTWVISAFSKYTDDENWIFDDVRFFNEVDGVKDKNGLLIRLEGDPKNIRENDTRDMNHESETQLDNCRKFDIIFDNDGPIENLSNLMSLIKDKI